MTDDLPFDYPSTANPGAPKPRVCRRHVWIRYDAPELGVIKCGRCGKPRDPIASRRGRNARQRGNAEELTVARKLGGRKMGPLGLPWDVEIEGYMRLQVKKLASWPSLAAVVALIDAIPAGRDMRGAALIQPGRGGRRLLVLDLDEFARWHGDPTKEAA